jgi:iron(III) transport system substrate-binding protein
MCVWVLRFLGSRANWLSALALLVSSLLIGPAAASEVVIYTSVDQEFAEPVLKQFEKQSGIKVKAVFDAEAAKTVGLERRLIAEKARPRADVFWNSEYLRTLRLGAEGVLTPQPPIAQSIPAEYRSKDALWIGFGLRARVLIVNTQLVPDSAMPSTLADLADPRWKGKVAIAKPYFGTTSTHFAALYSRWGEAPYTQFLQSLKANQVALLPGNADVRDAVAAGRFALGLTDSDDALGAIEAGKPVRMIFPDQGREGAFGVFHTVALIKGGPNPQAALRLAEYLASETTESELIRSGAVQLPVRAKLAAASAIGPAKPRIWHLATPELMPALADSARLIRLHLE